MLTPRLKPGTVAFQWNVGTPESYIREFEKATGLYTEYFPSIDGADACLTVDMDTMYDGDFVVVYPDKTVEVFTEYAYSVRFV